MLSTKKHSAQIGLFNALAEWQNNNHCSNQVLIFIRAALNPIRYVKKEENFHFLRNEVNIGLSFIGITLTEKGNYREVEKATTIAEANQRADRFKKKLENAKVHQIIFDYCKPELLTENYFHSVFEAIKSVADRIREMTGLYADGAELVDTTFSTKNPLVRINTLQNDNDRSEHLGLMHLIKGLFGLIRNPTAHKPKIKFNIDEEEALDLMIMISYAHKRLDKAL